MQKIKNAFAIGSLALLLGMTVPSCQKDLVDVPSDQKLNQISNLKESLAFQFRVTPNEIEYDSDKNIFILANSYEFSFDYAVNVDKEVTKLKGANK